MALSKEDFSIMLGTKIRELRKRKGLTMQQLANEVGIEYIQLSRIERAKINTTIYQVYIIYNFFGEPIDFIGS
jgi:transcriptional regulator with XRE-family HTH domain